MQQPLHNSVPLLLQRHCLSGQQAGAVSVLSASAEKPSCVCNKSFTLGCTTVSYMIFDAKDKAFVSQGWLVPFLKLDMSLSWQEALRQERGQSVEIILGPSCINQSRDRIGPRLI